MGTRQKEHCSAHCRDTRAPALKADSGSSRQAGLAPVAVTHIQHWAFRQKRGGGRGRRGATGHLFYLHGEGRGAAVMQCALRGTRPQPGAGRVSGPIPSHTSIWACCHAQRAGASRRSGCRGLRIQSQIEFGRHWSWPAFGGSNSHSVGSEAGIKCFIRVGPQIILIPNGHQQTKDSGTTGAFIIFFKKKLAGFSSLKPTFLKNFLLLRTGGISGASRVQFHFSFSRGRNHTHSWK